MSLSANLSRGILLAQELPRRLTEEVVFKTIICMLLLPAGPVWAETLTFAQAVSQMFQQNPALAQRKLDSRVSENRWRQSRAAYLPRLDFLQTFHHSNNPVYAFGTLLNQERFSQQNFAIDALNHPDAVTDLSSRFQVGWLIYDFGKRENQIHSAKSEYDIVTLQEESARILMLQELVKRYYALSLASHRVDVQKEAVRSAESLLQQAENRVATEMAVQSDLLTAQVFLARKVQERIDAQNQQKIAIASLLQLLGRDDEADVITSDPPEPHFMEQPLSWWQEQMQQFKPEWKLVSEASKMASFLIRRERANFLPVVQAWSSYEWHGESFSYTGNNYGVGLEVQWNLFKGYSDSRELAIAKLREQSTMERQREVESELILQLKAAYFQFQSAKEKLAVSKAAIQQSSENKRIFAERYAGGFATIHDSLQADTAYNETRLLHSQNLFDAYVSYTALLAAAGKGEGIERLGGQ
ncbi:TolC family protein [bacterium]|nr:TolC family protein [bacterium]